ncbi:hypothetical protein CSC82_13950 [Rhodobacteraceae bacterium 4F10]|nr:hypothetical protein CSC82_13950 [Rhodobacteraceae bacterium 4F10]
MMLEWVLDKLSIFSPNQLVALVSGLLLVLITYVSSDATQAGIVAIGSAIIVLLGFAINIDIKYGVGLLVAVYFGSWVLPNWEQVVNWLFNLFDSKECVIDVTQKGGGLGHESDIAECLSKLDPTVGKD